MLISYTAGITFLGLSLMMVMKRVYQVYPLNPHLSQKFVRC